MNSKRLLRARRRINGRGLLPFNTSRPSIGVRIVQNRISKALKR